MPLNHRSIQFPPKIFQTPHVRVWHYHPNPRQGRLVIRCILGYASNPAVGAAALKIGRAPRVPRVLCRCGRRASIVMGVGARGQQQGLASRNSPGALDARSKGSHDER
eukprot:866605-Prorocentrum_minimum.AAC.1